MKKLISTIAVICLFSAVPALADMTLTVAQGVGTTAGGEFIATVTGDPIGNYTTGQTFSTFCLELDEDIDFGPTYYAALSGSAIGGGIGGPSPDPLSDESAWVYTQWLDVLPHTAANADRVQRAIWYFEQEAAYMPWLATQAIAAVAGGWTNLDIRVVNLWLNSDLTGAVQDVLVRVPVPAAVVLGILGLGVAGWKLRRFA